MASHRVCSVVLCLQWRTEVHSKYVGLFIPKQASNFIAAFYCMLSEWHTPVYKAFLKPPVLHIT